LIPPVFEQMVADCRQASNAMGDPTYGPTEAQTASHALRRSLWWACDLPGGTTIERQHLTVARPGLGAPPSRIDTLVGTRLDSEVRKGKMSGAFCASVQPELTPWGLTNYQGRANDVATLAHELGHAIHAMLAEDHTQFTFHSSLPLAETASW